MQNTSHTFESVWATLDRVGAKLDRLAERQAETDRAIKETDRIVKETTASIKETDRIVKETAASIKETTASIKETDRIVKETTASIKETDKLISALGKQLGGMANSNGDAAEEYFFNTFEHGNKILFGEKFDYVWGSIPGREKGFQDEYDIVLLNGKSICIVEVKYKADSANFQKLLQKPVTFRENYPKYNKHKVYLALASMSFHKRTEQTCKENGIAIIKQVGETVVIFDEHIKVF